MTEETLSKGERTRNTIVDAAYSLMVVQGYAATSMRQIADRAGLALGGIYNHFSSKEEVFQTIIQDRHPFFQIFPVLQDVEGDTVDEYIHNAAHSLIAQLGKHPDFLNLMLIEIVEFKGKHVPVLFKKMFHMIMPIAEHISELDGRLRSFPPPVLMRAFLGMFFSYYITEILLAPVMLPEMRVDALDHFADIFLHGILFEEKV